MNDTQQLLIGICLEAETEPTKTRMLVNSIRLLNSISREKLETPKSQKIPTLNTSNQKEVKS